MPRKSPRLAMNPRRSPRLAKIAITVCDPIAEAKAYAQAEQAKRAKRAETARRPKQTFMIRCREFMQEFMEIMNEMHDIYSNDIYSNDSESDDDHYDVYKN
jgi:hypothetical protein